MPFCSIFVTLHDIALGYLMEKYFKMYLWSPLDGFVAILSEGR